MPVYLIAADAGDRNHDLYFHPLSEAIRGAFRVQNVRLESAFRLFALFPNGIPGQGLGVDTENGECFVLEPLSDPKNKAVRDAVMRAFGRSALPLEPAKPDANEADLSAYVDALDGVKTAQAIDRQGDTVILAPHLRIVPGANVADWLYWMFRAVQAGLAKVPKGYPPLPTEHPEARKGHGRQMMTDPKDAQIAALLAALLSKMNPAERKQYEAIMNPPKA